MGGRGILVDGGRLDDLGDLQNVVGHGERWGLLEVAEDIVQLGKKGKQQYTAGQQLRV